MKLALTAPGPGTPLTAVGFGVDEKAAGLPPPGRPPPPINRSLKYTTVRTSADACTSPPKGTICAVGLKQLGGFSGTCAGDSGGPEINSQGQQVSVTSYGPDVDCGTGAWAVYTSVADYYSSFIKPALDKYAGGGVDGSSPPNADDGSGGNGPNGGANGPNGGGNGPNGGGGNGPNGGGNGSNGGGGNGPNGGPNGGGGGGGNNSANSGNIEDEGDDSAGSGSGTGGGCQQWTWNSAGNQRIVFGTQVGFPVKVLNALACGNKCGATADCNSFHYQRGLRRCTMFEEGAGKVDTVRDTKFVAGYLTCGDKKK